MSKLWSLLIAICLCVTAANVRAQDVLTKGTIGGTVTDAAGAAVPGATITVSGPQVQRRAT